MGLQGVSLLLAAAASLFSTSPGVSVPGVALSGVAVPGVAVPGMLGVVVRPVTLPGLHTEGPVWDPRRRGLLFVDIAAQTLNFYDPTRQIVHSASFDGPVTPVLHLADDSLAVGVGLQLRRLEADWAVGGAGTTRPTAIIATLDSVMQGTRFNDGNVDARGRIWVGTMGPEPTVGHVVPDQGSLYRITLGKHLAAQVETVLAPVNISNGLTWDLTNTLMYYIDTPTRRVDVFDFNLDDGTIAKRRPAFDFALNNVTGNPDGMTIDSDGNLWVASFGGHEVIQVDPRVGRLLRRVPIPASQVTAVALGGPLTHNLEILSTSPPCERDLLTSSS